MNSKYLVLSGLFCYGMLLSSCKKFLDAKPDQSFNTPTTLNDLQMLLDNYGIMNMSVYSNELLADNYYLTSIDWNALTDPSQKNYYIWQREDQSVSEWTVAYRTVFYANVVLDALKTMEVKPSDAPKADGIKGAALFYRAFSFWSLAQLFAPPFDSTAADRLPGIPLRLSPDIEERSVRASLAETYERIIADFTTAATLLPASTVYPNRPSKAAALGALARTFLSRNSYSKAYYYADSALQVNHALMDFNALSAAAALPIPRFNAEVLYPAVSTGSLNLNPSRAKVDSVLYNSYAANNLRRSVFFKSNGNGSFAFKGSYDGSATGAVFTGITTPELYLVKAEALARMNRPAEAMATLNALLIKRWKTGTFVPLTAAGGADALVKVLNERRKELCFKGLRWTDLRRLNLEPPFVQTLQRQLGSQTFTLNPNSNAYTLLLPRKVIELSGMPQNP